MYYGVTFFVTVYIVSILIYKQFRNFLMYWHFNQFFITVRWLITNIYVYICRYMYINAHRYVCIKIQLEWELLESSILCQSSVDWILSTVLKGPNGINVDTRVLLTTIVIEREIFLLGSVFKILVGFTPSFPFLTRVSIGSCQGQSHDYLLHRWSVGDRDRIL